MGGVGLAARAGRLHVGAEAVRRAIRDGRAVAVLIAGDAPARTRVRLERLAQSRTLPNAVVVDGERLGRALGRPRVVAIALTDESLGRRVLKLARAVER